MFIGYNLQHFVEKNLVLTLISVSLTDFKARFYIDFVDFVDFVAVLQI